MLAGVSRTFGSCLGSARLLEDNLLVIGELAQFPVRFLHPDDQWFFAIIGRALLDSVVLGITRLTDQGGDLLSLLRFRNLVFRMLREEATDEFRKTLKATSFDPATKALAVRARDLRDGRIAHLRLDDIKNGKAVSLALPELESLVLEMERLFRPLLFGAEVKLIPSVYDPQIRRVNRPWVTDYEAVLEALARKSHVLRYPEQDPEVWSDVRRTWKADDLAALNFWRRRIGLPEA